MGTIKFYKKDVLYPSIKYIHKSMSFLKKISMKKVRIIIFLIDFTYTFEPHPTFFLRHFKSLDFVQAHCGWLTTCNHLGKKLTAIISARAAGGTSPVQSTTACHRVKSWSNQSIKSSIVDKLCKQGHLKLHLQSL